LISMIFDSFGRPTLNLRVAVTPRCNLRCFYCHREGEQPHESDEMKPGEIHRIVKIASELGIRNLKITGGEPLIRDDIAEIVNNISDVPNLNDISMTTNGTLLAGRAEELKACGLRRINISLVSLNEDVYFQSTGGRLSDALRGVEDAISAGLEPIKINALILNGTNTGEIEDFVRFAGDRSVILQLIELESVNLDDSTYKKFHYPLDDVERKLSVQASNVEHRALMQNRRIYHLPGKTVEVVRHTEGTEFCLRCTRLRVTSDGKLKPCLLRNNNLVDILTPMREGASDRDLKEIFLKAIGLREPYYKT